MQAYRSAYNEEKAHAFINSMVHSSYGYIFHKASTFLLVGADTYECGDFFHYPLAEWNQEKLKSGCRQFIEAKGVTEQQCLENLTLDEIRDLFEMFHFSLLKVEPTFKKYVSKITFKHKVTKVECFVFCKLEK